MKTEGKKKQYDLREVFISIKNDPEKIIAWAEKEIREYEKLIKLMKKKLKK